MGDDGEKKWNDNSEYVLNIVPPPQLMWLHVLMQLSMGYEIMEHGEGIFQIIHC